MNQAELRNLLEVHHKFVILLALLIPGTTSTALRNLLEVHRKFVILLAVLIPGMTATASRMLALSTLSIWNQGERLAHVRHPPRLTP